MSHRSRPPRARRRDRATRSLAADAPQDPAPPSEARAGRSRWSFVRVEYGLLVLIALMMTVFAFAFFFFDVDVAQLNTYGYVGLFAISLISAASIVLPMPGVAAIAGAGALLEPVLGIPVPVLVALVAGPAEAIGEITGYAAGYGGSVLFQDRPFYPRVKAWMERRGILTMFALSSFPNPLVDVAGVAAGAVHMPLSHFYIGVLPGKIVKNLYLAAGGLAIADLVQRLFG